MAVILVAAGYTLVYAGMKGDHYKLGGTPVWKQPWLPFIAVFSRNPQLAAAQLDSTDSNTFFADAAAAATASSSSSGQPSASPSVNVGQLPPPGPGQTYA